VPLKISDQITLTIHDIAFGGEGVGRVDDFVVFVPFVLVGETIAAEITEVKKNFARAKLLRVEQPSPERVEAECRYFGACGGCQYQHVAYPAQLQLKHKQISDLFERVGKIPSDKIAPVIPCPQPFGYRNRIMIRSQWNKPEQKLNIGFIRADCGLVEDIEECKIAEPALNEQIRHVRAHPAAEGRHQGRAARATGKLGRAAGFIFPEQFFPAAGAGRGAVRGFLRDSGARHLIDLYCGVGFFRH
jgi:23S rRNA (uracil1939-C5)-methyltransferase